MKQLIHNGVIVLKPFQEKGLKIKIGGEEVLLTAFQEEVAYAWCKKLETDYVKDPVFRRNFLKDFKKFLGYKKRLKLEDIDFFQVISRVDFEKKTKEEYTKEEKKALALKRKEIREKNKEEFGFAIVDGEKVELANYATEPSGIFMGRGKHPKRGSWKKGAEEEDIILNLSPDAKIPEGNWKEVVWESSSLWIAKWKDSLTNKIKYVWLSDSSPIKQEREKKKFEKAWSLDDHIDEVRKYIYDNISSKNEKTKQTATVCALIESIALRVGDEKNEDEADTVGASTLRGEHLKIISENKVSFDFLGKDSIRMNKTVKLPQELVINLEYFMSRTEKKGFLFPKANSRDVNCFLNEVYQGLTAKVFRTYIASKTVKEYFKKTKITKEEPEHKKRLVAKMANLEAAKICNHMKKVSKNYKSSIKKKKERINILKDKLLVLKNELKDVREIKPKRELKTKKQKSTFRKRKRKKVQTLKNRIKKTEENIEKSNSRLKESRLSHTYNLGTSLKNYIDPRIYYDWGKVVDYNWRNFYSKTLQKKFQWVEKED
ncbi:MAG: DNA topoisomerase I [Candidatus Ranarchaeia archaeon]